MTAIHYFSYLESGYKVTIIFDTGEAFARKSGIFAIAESLIFGIFKSLNEI
jgi:hypothetical protein